MKIISLCMGLKSGTQVKNDSFYLVSLLQYSSSFQLINDYGSPLGWRIMWLWFYMAFQLINLMHTLRNFSKFSQQPLQFLPFMKVIFLSCRPIVLCCLQKPEVRSPQIKVFSLIYYGFCSMGVEVCMNDSHEGWFCIYGTYKRALWKLETSSKSIILYLNIPSFLCNDWLSLRSVLVSFLCKVKETTFYTFVMAC